MVSRNRKKTKFKQLSLTAAAVIFASMMAIVAGRQRFEGILRGPASYGQSDRSPAAIQKVFDFSYLQGSAFQKAAKHRMFSSLDIVKKSDEVVIELGNFVLSNEKSEKEFACGYFDRFELIFEADGISADGDKPELSIESRCRVSENINQLVPVRIPMLKIATEEPGNAEYKFFDNEHPVTVKFTRTTSSWPRRWILTGIKLTHSKMPFRILVMNSYEMLAIRPKPVTMNW
jgi:hypothetical protein